MVPEHVPKGNDVNIFVPTHSIGTNSVLKTHKNTSGTQWSGTMLNGTQVQTMMKDASRQKEILVPAGYIKIDIEK